MLLLASRSPRRAELLRTLGVEFSIIDVEIDEVPRPPESPRDYVTRLAAAKAAAGRHAAGPGRPVLAADTTVVVEGEMIGKPRDAGDAERILSGLSDRWHSVLTAVALLVAEHAPRLACVETRVRFRPLTHAEIRRYWASGEPADKAGAYGIQGLGGAFVTRIEGSPSNVIGLPLAETLQLLQDCGIPHALSPQPRDFSNTK